MKKREDAKLTVEEFVLLALKKLKKPDYDGIHTVYSGFNEGFREYFPDLDPVKEIKLLSEQGKIWMRPSRGGEVI